ncbi:MAG: hypothetical protein SPE99_08600 [Blautia sp.]|nr:hypothetical protein [Blautia sp.]
MRGIRSVDTIVDLCKRDLAFIWMTCTISLYAVWKKKVLLR